MPELPEVEVVRRGLESHVVGRHVDAVTLTGVRVARRHLPGPRDLESRLTGQDVLAADRRGKYLWLVVGRDEIPSGALVLHLGMSGQLLVQPATAAPQKHLHATLDLTDPATGPGSQLRFVDQRTFGGLAWADLVPDPATGPGEEGRRAFGIPASIVHIAPDPLEPAFDRAAVVRRMKARHVAVKRALLDQGLVSGIGNIYADEALWRAGVHGLRDTDALTRPALGRILDHAADVMREALAQGGTSFDALYVNVNGNSGYFDRSLDAYGRQGLPCRRCGTPMRREAFMNRSSHSCPRCQPRPRAPLAASGSR
ncbi:bifunctional DNA-formamidopyrimidine glycosylase/DNA-(apurinic or apyrimidinic site) lyase [Arsenicicoccus sp. oral taxon 190]|uniref:bifunctional DNA-formamidopyrimidine glycosylase/DNA-(apurinic or apyrimidinic site) lyase n=1 Tax=Arsenicicoccus sp. oral taxon 190 TaxID=1658671 RepID=UPI000679EDC7|nr:bifunctional DNA-formamidopyrimidine glycosylase/DNA-(apurinic or apyrimidinic site) lyase [Arsenicicoccus sp. oral taxon 190]AKT52262.1 5-hydroxymethyluracil DNA glycosylase [Arsenicicoccus sp. oral taxon 190]